ncbi:endonuclease reverse transcriptase [Pelobates cultripes]|uniref:Endonuclease reverse transcriptase n=1 Tax=Pelobates cultripes TaxID=61616 RepID=A0AAD1W529_PELCU|nr:endonuclease reverse transcriptase [Pelobates cultripes]
MKNLYDFKHRSPWKLNNTLLHNDEYMKELADDLTLYFTQNDNGEMPPTTIWQAHKAVIRGLLIRKVAYIKKQAQITLKTWQRELYDLNRSNQLQPTAENRHLIMTISRLIHQQALEQTQTNMTRLKISHYIQGNKASKLLANQLKQKQANQKIAYILDNKGQKHATPREISETFAKYYHTLYNLKGDSNTTQPTDTSIKAYLDKLALPQLTPQQQADLTKHIDIQEMLKVIQTLPTGKSPGPDGLTNLYYKKLSHVLAPHLTTAFNHATAQKSLPREMLLAPIVTLPKPNKPPTTPKIFRPISLLNTEAKLFAKLYATRLGLIIPHIIHNDQVGFVKGRQGSDNTRKAINLLYKLQTQKEGGLFLSLDAEKAFDRLH